MLKLLRTVMPVAAVVMMAAGCSHTAEPEWPSAPADAPAREDSDMARLHINLSVGYGPGVRSRAAVAYDGPVSSQEKLHTVRIIILDGEGYVEHNTLWDLSANPAVLASGRPFPVKKNDDKTILFIGNESSFKVSDPADGGKTCGADEYFSRFYVASGESRLHMDLAAVEALTIPTEHNGVFASQNSDPLPVTAIYKGFHIGAESEHVDGQFYMYRAAAKYTYRIKNASPKESAVISAVTVNNVASAQSLFFNAEFTDETRSDYKGYTPLAGAGKSTVTFSADVEIAAGETAEIGPFYLPEGPKVGATAPYCTGLTIDGEASAMHELRLKPGAPMTDLPRNTHLVIEGSFIREPHTIINITVCPWMEYETTIPDFN